VRCCQVTVVSHVMSDFVKFKPKYLCVIILYLFFTLHQKIYIYSSTVMSESRYRSSQKTENSHEVGCLLDLGTMIAFIFSTLSLKWSSGMFVRQSMLDLTVVIKL